MLVEKAPVGAKHLIWKVREVSRYVFEPRQRVGVVVLNAKRFLRNGYRLPINRSPAPLDSLKILWRLGPKPEVNSVIRVSRPVVSPAAVEMFMGCFPKPPIVSAKGKVFIYLLPGKGKCSVSPLRRTALEAMLIMGSIMVSNPCGQRHP